MHAPAKHLQGTVRVSMCFPLVVLVALGLAAELQSRPGLAWFDRSLVGMEVGLTGAQFGHSDPSDAGYCSKFDGREVIRRGAEPHGQYVVIWARDDNFACDDSKLLLKAPGLGIRDPLRQTVDEARQRKLPAIACGLTLAASASMDKPKRHPWLPPFDLGRVGSGGGAGDFEADAVVHTEPRLNPVDLGAILVPHDWLLLEPEQVASVEVAAVSNHGDEPNAHLRVWFASEPNRATSTPFPLTERVRVQRKFSIPPAPRKRDRDVLHVAIQQPNRAILWEKTVPTMLVSKRPRWPRFGATATKLRYDAPISVRNENGTFSTLDYSKGWDASLEDVVVCLPNGTRFVFWRGSCYVPFWAGRHNTCLSYEWAETTPPPDGFTDCVEPLMDKELRYGRVEIIESTSARAHVRWSYQSCDFKYKVWGDSAVEDFYFYPDGFGTRVVTLQSALDSNYELSEFIILTPQDAYPFSVLPTNLVGILFLDGEKREITFPYDVAKQGSKMQSRDATAVYRVRLHKDDPMTAIYFHAEDRRLPPVVFGPFKDGGCVVTPCYWGSHWPLARGQTTGGAINDRIHASPAHNSVMSWAMQRPPPLRETRLQAPDTLGRSRPMRVQTWVWLIGLTDAEDARVLDWAKSFAAPPSLELNGARLEAESFSPERRAIRLVVEGPLVTLKLRPLQICVNPVFEMRNTPPRLLRVELNGLLLPREHWAWDGKTLWLETTLREPAELALDFGRGS